MRAKVTASWSMVAVLAGAVALLPGCGGNGSGGIDVFGGKTTLGVACDVGDSVNAPSVLAANPQARECASKLCLYPARDRTTDTGPLCTVSCVDDHDCAQGQQRGRAPGDHRCQAGFVCRTLVPKIENSPLACRPLCVCRDFLSPDDPGLRPLTCP